MKIAGAHSDRKCEHYGQKVRVGPYSIMAGGARDLMVEDLVDVDVLIPLTGDGIDLPFGQEFRVLSAPLRNYEGVPPEWRDFLETKVIPTLASGARVLTYCMGSHGRTGTMLASLVALLETKKETPDPIAAVRKRHCDRAVESTEQAKAIFALRGQRLPKKYKGSFRMDLPSDSSSYSSKAPSEKGGLSLWSSSVLGDSTEAAGAEFTICCDKVVDWDTGRYIDTARGVLCLPPCKGYDK